MGLERWQHLLGEALQVLYEELVGQGTLIEVEQQRVRPQRVRQVDQVLPHLLR
jgi:hypothetical protein